MNIEIDSTKIKNNVQPSTTDNDDRELLLKVGGYSKDAVKSILGCKDRYDAIEQILGMNRK